MEIAKYWKTIVDTMQDGLMVLDPVGNILAVNPAAERLTALHHIEPAVRAAMEATVDELRAGGATWAEIGRLGGVTRQAAQIRFGRNRP